MDTEIAQLDRVLSQIQLLDPPHEESAERDELYQEICRLLFEDELYMRIWSESTLNQLQELFQTENPDEQLFETELEEIRRRTIAVKEINDCFFGIVDQDTTTEELREFLSKIQRLPDDFCQRLAASGRLEELRNQERCTCEKVEGFLELVKDDLSVDLTGKESVIGVLASLKSRNTVGRVHALLVKGSGKAIAVPLHIKLQPSTQAKSCTKSRGARISKTLLVELSPPREKKASCPDRKISFIHLISLTRAITGRLWAWLRLSQCMMLSRTSQLTHTPLSQEK